VRSQDKRPISNSAFALMQHLYPEKSAMRGAKLLQFEATAGGCPPPLWPDSPAVDGPRPSSPAAMPVIDIHHPGTAGAADPLRGL
jgi:hypothetical protein